jgi:hypothetical protein
MEDPHAPDARPPLHVILYRWGAVIFVLGLATSLVLYILAADDTRDPTRQITRAKMYQHNIELMGGKGALYAARFNDWFADLWHGHQLAWTIAVISVVVAAICFLLGLLISEPLPVEPDEQGADRQ